MSEFSKPKIIPRENLDFGLDGDIPKYWIANDPMKTRFFDAMSLTFPEGERSFIKSVRAFKHKITDPQLIAEVKAFTRQEAQHGIAHQKYNDRLKEQGVEVDKLEKIYRSLLTFQMKVCSDNLNLALTAAAEHTTAIMCYGVVGMGKKELFQQFDHRMRALYTWHSIEELEHKAVAFDVMSRHSTIGYFRRSLILLVLSFNFFCLTFYLMNSMLRSDGFSIWRRATMWPSFLWWLFKPMTGFISQLTWHYLQWFKPGFHPWKNDEVAPFYHEWMAALKTENNDPVKATNKFYTDLANT